MMMTMMMLMMTMLIMMMVIMMMMMMTMIFLGSSALVPLFLGSLANRFPGSLVPFSP
jgi:hypothetical protein